MMVKSSSALLRGVTSKNNEDFYCINCLHLLRTECNPREKSMKVPFIIHADLESLLEKRLPVIRILKSHQQPNK